MIRFAACVLALAGTAFAARAGELDREATAPATPAAPAVAAAPGGTELDQESPTAAHRYRGGWGYGGGWYGGYGYRPYYSSFSIGFGRPYYGGFGYPAYYGGFGGYGFGYRPVGFSVGFTSFYGGYGYGFGPGCWY